MTIYYNVHYKDSTGRYIESHGKTGEGVIQRYASWESFKRYALQGLVEALRENPRFVAENDPILYLYSAFGEDFFGNIDTVLHQFFYLCPKNVITEIRA